MEICDNVPMDDSPKKADDHTGLSVVVDTDKSPQLLCTDSCLTVTWHWVLVLMATSESSLAWSSLGI